MKTKIANWGNYPVIESKEERFVFADQLDTLIKDQQPFIARGNGRCYGDASLSARTISTLKFDKVLSFNADAGFFECQSGITLDQILAVIVPKGWFLPVTPGTKFITIGGALASDVHGKNHHVDGSISNHVIEFDMVLASDEVVTCSPVNNSELFEATCGGMGLTGVITRVKFRLKKIETSLIRQKQVKAANLQELIELFDTYKDYTYSVAWIDCLKKGAHFGRSILILGEHATIAEVNENQRSNPLALPVNKQIVFPINMPGWVLNKFTVKAFNFLYYAKNLKKEINNIVSYEPFFYPLDKVLHWNRLYGKKGFVQYQFVLPLNARQGLVEIMNRISDEGLGSFLAVLKVFGKQESMISFPKEGYTLALDFPIRKGLLDFLDELDELVLKYNGRLYMSKDARMKPQMLTGGYPELEKFKSIIKRYNPDGKIRSVQSDRLLLTEIK
ncbi:FAD-binding oxidoreductase [Mucilaginibacter xinganensis]|uniref:Decaprenylphosphoryl-beta-D-ribose oxidase, putative n=1 Tax=Mucilaginibacter xinganensis TaxID=1234841 RepID=A0A223NZW8_9SPHI|nr:FAD-binding oxidoreductase [Mucilaginibacter xinganensis]ASU35121.1 decaprenylphosphoryl-beta-D-ribose oxidase, putative [Mucilaginibacter xinganensis]